MSLASTDLDSLPIFGTLSPAELETLASRAERLDVSPDVELTHEGDFGHSVFVVLEGQAQVKVEGREVRDLARGDVFGEIAVLSSGRRTATVVSLTQMVLASFFKRDVWEIEKENEAFASELRKLRELH